MREAAIISALRSGAISLNEACDRYDMSEEEFTEWEGGFDTTASEA
jgi:hypothetical protein